MNPKEFPVDIFAIKEYGIKNWQSEFFWPVSDEDYFNLCGSIDGCLIRWIETQPEEMSDLLLIISSLRAEYWHFLHALKVAQDISAEGGKILYSGDALWYKEIIGGGPIPVRGFRRGKSKPALSKRIKADMAKTVWKLQYNKKIGKLFCFRKNRDITEIYGAVTPLMKLYIRNSQSLFNFTSDYDWLGGKSTRDLPQGLLLKIGEVSKNIANDLTSIARDHEIMLSAHHSDYLKNLTEGMLTNAAQIMYSVKGRLKKNGKIKLITSSFVSIFARVLCVAIRRLGGHVVTFNHGNGIGIYDSPGMAFLEFAVSDEFIIYNKKTAGFFESIKNSHPHIRNNKTIITSLDSDGLYKIWEKNRKKLLPEKMKKVMVIGYPHNQSRQYGAAGSFSPIQLDFELRVADILKRSGYEVIYKAHPDRLAEVEGIFGQKTSVIKGYFEDRMDMADAFLFGSIRTTAFPIALCTNKPVIGFMMESERFKPFPEALGSLKKRCSMVKAKFDERNRIVFDEKELLGALAQKPAQPDTEFMKKYIFPNIIKVDGL